MKYTVDVNEIYPNGLKIGDVKELGKEFRERINELEGIYAKRVLNRTVIEILSKIQFYEKNAKICKRTDKLINESKALALRDILTQITYICKKTKEEELKDD